MNVLFPLSVLFHLKRANSCEANFAIFDMRRTKKGLLDLSEESEKRYKAGIWDGEDEDEG